MMMTLVTMMMMMMMMMMVIMIEIICGILQRLHWIDFVRTDGSCDFEAKEEVNSTIIINSITKLVCNPS